MARTWNLKNLSFWHVVPVALVLHGLILRMPIALEEPAAQEKPKANPVKMQKLPVSNAVSTKPSPSPPSAIAPPSVQPQPSQQPPIQQVQQPIQQVQQPIQQVQQPIQQQQSPPQQQQPQQQQPQQQPPQQQPPVETPSAFQIQGATACVSVKDCYASSETNGRSIAQTLEDRIKAEGYVLDPIELGEDTGMKIYRLFQKGQPKDYLHIIWSDKGTRSLRLPQMEKDYDQLARIAKL
jgi:hypothetical protein